MGNAGADFTETLSQLQEIFCFVFGRGAGAR
jgi:hypothetical protein